MGFALRRDGKLAHWKTKDKMVIRDLLHEIVHSQVSKLVVGTGPMH